MEHVDASFHDGEWESLCGMFSFETELERFTAPEILGERSSQHEGSSYPSHSSSMVGVTENLLCSHSDSNTSFQPYYPCFGTQHFFNGFNQSSLKNDASMCMDIAEKSEKQIPSIPFWSENIAQKGGCVNPAKENQLKRKFDITNETDLFKNTKKKQRVLRAADERGKRIPKSKQNEKLTMNTNNQDDNAGSDGQSLSSYGSDEDNASPETNVARKLKSKTRASRGTATDPQSLYARKRRERINERLKTLQNLVPNGTKVDISTMLEEAVHYVKFLQVQIKLLSSDDLWMFAPLAYSGFDIGLPHKIISQLLKE